MSRSSHEHVFGGVNRLRAVMGLGVLAASLGACSDSSSSAGGGLAGDGAQPVSTQPVSTQPVSTQPVSTQPVSTQPVSTPSVSTPTGHGVVPPPADAVPPSATTPSPSAAEGNPAPVAVTPPSSGEAPPGGTGEAEPVIGASPPADAPPTDAPVEAAVGPEPLVATRALCTGVDPIQCHFGGQPGNYDVTVVLGGAAAARTTVLAEARRTMLAAVATPAGTTRRLTFSVNVRQPEGEPIQAVPAGTPGLDLYFLGSEGAPPALESIGFRPAQEPTVVYVAGDSTVADQTDVEYGGWAQQLPQHFAYPVVVANYADSGESSGSFLNAQPLFAAIESRLTPKDWVLIQFGHNDKQVAADIFRNNITALVTRVKAKGASPVLLTPVARAQFNGDQVAVQHINGVGANLPAIIREVAQAQAVPLLDLTARTSDWLRETGPSGWQPFHALGTDPTHTNDAGARAEAEFVRELLIQAGVEPLVSRLR